MSDATLVNAETGERAPAVPDEVRMSWDPFTPEQAEAHTNKITATAKVLCMLVLEAHDAKAHVALGYATWGEYVADRLDISRSRSYQLLAKGRLAMMSAGVVGLPVSTVVDTVPEAATRGISAERLREVIADALLSLPQDATTAQRLAIVERSIDTLRGEVAEAKRRADRPKQPPKVKPEPDPVADAMTNAAAAANQAATSSDAGSSHPPASDAPDPTTGSGATSPGKAGVPTDAVATGDTEQSGQPAAHADGAEDEGQPVPPPVAPVLPDDWRDRLARATQILGCDPDLLGVALTADDVIDLTDLAAHVASVLAAHHAIKEQA